MEARKLVHSVVEKIVIDPRHGRGTVYLPQDVCEMFMRETSTRGTLRDPTRTLKHLVILPFSPGRDV